MARNDTIAAVATAPGRGGIAAVRVSGPDAFAVAERVTGRRPAAGRASFAKFRSPLEPFPVVDEGVVLAFAAPRSYTGEDVVELQGHGGAVAPRRVLEACLAAGARPARRGEFTERAFLNGKLSIEQAEAVLDLVNAKTVRAADEALGGLADAKTRRIGELYEKALAISSEVEHSLDVDEGELGPDFAASVERSIAGLEADSRALAKEFAEGRILREGALVVLTGAPNAGKSSLMNALLGENRAIVSDVPGTTRDSIEEWLDIGGWPVRLVDTAGVREAEGEIEAEGVRRAGELVAKADVVLALDPASPPPSTASVVGVLSKCDLVRGGSAADGAIAVSSATGEGLAELKSAIVARLEARAESAACGAETDDPRSSALVRALAELAGRTAAGRDLVLLGGLLRRVCEILADAVGARYSDDLLDRLFSRFCVGK